MNRYGVIIASMLIFGSASAADIFGGINKALGKVQETVDSTRATVDNTQTTVDNANRMVDEAKATADNAKNIGKGTVATAASPARTGQSQSAAQGQPQAAQQTASQSAPAATFKSACWNYNMNSNAPLNCNACEQQYQSQGMLARLNEFAAAGKKAQVDAFLTDCPRAAQ